MEAQFGEWRFDGGPHRGTESAAADLYARFGFGRDSSYRGAGTEIHCFSPPVAAPCSTRQPVLLPSGEVLVWDGRLDNRSELASDLNLPSANCDNDVVSSAWLRWQDKALCRLLGDWSLSVWDPRLRLLLLATDILGSQHLYYAPHQDLVRWSTTLEPLFTVEANGLSLDPEYVAGWIGSFPRADRSPFQEIRRVPPASAVRISPRGCEIWQYWSFNCSRRIRYRSDADYEAHFLDLFRQSVRRRLRSAGPVLAELSGGVDSSAIVSMADRISSAEGRPLIDTVSYYNNTEPNWNEQLWFSRIEQARGRTGLHVDLSQPVCFEQRPADAAVPCWPGGARTAQNKLIEYMGRGGHRVLLSGIGGDEFLGGVPTPLPELENLLARAHLLRLTSRLVEWSLAQRRPLAHLVLETAAGFLPVSIGRKLRQRQLPSWIDGAFAVRHRRALEGYARRWHVFGPLPAFQENIDTLETIRRQLSCTEITLSHPFEKRYPFLDRDLLEYLFSIPREQLVRPGQRRSLMRRALKGIVPAEILERKRKAYVTRTPLRMAEAQYEALSRAGRRMISETSGYADTAAFVEALNAARQGRNVPIMPLLRTIALEQWLEALHSSGTLRQNFARPEFAGVRRSAAQPGVSSLR